MSLITCCPACGTMFKVVPDQLKISEGWVRCGHCAEVFDATAHFQQPGQPPRQPAAAQFEEPAAPIESPMPLPLVADDQAHAEPRPEPSPEALEPPVSIVGGDTGYPPFEFVRADVDEPTPASGFEEVTGTSAEPTDFPDDGDSQLHDLGFVRKARRKAFWRRPAVRGLMALVALALGLVLVLQWAFHERDRLAAAHPQLRPWLESLCEPLACQVSAPRQIEAIVIDASTFNRLRTDAYRLSFTLKNQGAVDVAMPAVELTLTDTQDQPVVRRVLMPPDLGSASSVIAAGAEWSGTLALTVAANGNSGRIAGYRLLAFYP